MPIIHLATSKTLPADAINAKDISGKDGACTDTWTYETHHGLCIRDSEVNGYQDSDFYMLVWNPKKGEPEEIMFATTRGWSYPCYSSSADASEETMMAYNAWLTNRRAEGVRLRRRGEAKRLLAFRKLALQVARKHGISHVRLTSLRRLIGLEAANLILELFSPRVRSNFKLSLRQQVVNWLQQENPTYPTPLSRRQLEKLQQGYQS